MSEHEETADGPGSVHGDGLEVPAAGHYPPGGETSELAEAGEAGAICPRCGSWQVIAGHLLDGLGQPARFALVYGQRAPGVGDTDAPRVLALYCNACGEVTLTLE